MRVYGYVLYVNDAPTQQFFPTLKSAQEAAKSHIAQKNKLRIETTNDTPTRIWNYKYDRDQWVQFME